MVTSHLKLAMWLNQAMLWCAVNGMGLALVIPCIQSLIADYNPAEKRGSAFGLMFFISSMGEATSHDSLTDGHGPGHVLTCWMKCLSSSGVSLMLPAKHTKCEHISARY